MPRGRIKGTKIPGGYKKKKAKSPEEQVEVSKTDAIETAFQEPTGMDIAKISEEEEKKAGISL